nr:MAG TPA: hypothetical protein [Caudoviricetes sp.]
MITLQDVKHLGITNQINITRDLGLLNEHLSKLIDFKNAHKTSDSMLFYDYSESHDDNGVTYSFGGYCGYIDLHLSNADILKWRKNHPECCCERVRDIITMNYNELSAYAGMKHCNELVGHEILCVAAALGDMSLNVKNNALISLTSNTLTQLGLYVGHNKILMRELKHTAKVVADAFDEVFQIVK